MSHDLPGERTETVGAKRPKASVSERAGVMMNMKARILLEALTGAWPKLSRIGGKRADLTMLPPELCDLAESTRARDELLEHLTNDVLYYNK